jgi:hypothetical protein
MTMTETLMYYWWRTGEGEMLFCQLAKTIWWPGRIRYPEPEEAVQERLL